MPALTGPHLPQRRTPSCWAHAGMWCSSLLSLPRRRWCGTFSSRETRGGCLTAGPRITMSDARGLATRPCINVHLNRGDDDDAVRREGVGASRVPLRAIYT
jgi:hypothetical protein